jgi:hypothetical protein
MRARQLEPINGCRRERDSFQRSEERQRERVSSTEKALIERNQAKIDRKEVSCGQR